MLLPLYAAATFASFVNYNIPILEEKDKKKGNKYCFFKIGFQKIFF